MNYTIAFTEACQTGIAVNFDKHGNKYVVGLYKKECKEYTCKEFDKIDEAYVIYEKLVKAIVFGEYSYEQRKAMLE